MEDFHGRACEDMVAFLARREALNNLMIGLIADVRAGIEVGGKGCEPPFLLDVWDGGERQCVVLRTPPFPFVICDFPENERGDDLADELVSIVFDSPGFSGPDWLVRKMTDRLRDKWEVEMLLGVFECTEKGLVMPQDDRRLDSGGGGGGSGCGMREANREDSSDVKLVEELCNQFEQEGHAGAASTLGGSFTSGQRRFFFDRQNACMAGLSGKTPNGIRVGPVFTVPQYRRLGKAQQMVGELTALAFREGNRCVFLFTDLTNPTSNGVYLRLGYVQVETQTKIRILPSEVKQ